MIKCNPVVKKRNLAVVRIKHKQNQSIGVWGGLPTLPHVQKDPNAAYILYANTYSLILLQGLGQSWGCVRVLVALKVQGTRLAKLCNQQHSRDFL